MGGKLGNFLVWRSGGDDSFSDEAQSGHVANDSYGTEEPGNNTKPGQDTDRKIAKDSLHAAATRQWERPKTASPDKRRRLECFVKARKALLEAGDEDHGKGAIGKNEATLGSTPARKRPARCRTNGRGSKPGARKNEHSPGRDRQDPIHHPRRQRGKHVLHKTQRRKVPMDLNSDSGVRCQTHLRSEQTV